MATRQSEARARVSLDPKPFEKGAKAVVQAAESMSSTIKSAFATAGIAILAALGARTISGLVNTIRETIEFGEAMANAGKRAGIAAGQFYLFNSAMEKGIGLKTAASLLGKNAEVLNRSANVFRDVSLKLWAIGEQIRGFWLGMMERISPVLSKILDGALGDALLEAGNTFGEAIANAIKVIYQLAKDGKLWDTFKQGFAIAFDYARERMEWLGRVGFEIFKLVFTDSFTDGVYSALGLVSEALSALAKNFGEEVAKSTSSALARTGPEINATMLNGFDRVLEKMGLVKKGYAKSRADGRNKDLNSLITKKDTENTSNELPKPNGSNFVEKFQDILSKNKFEQSGGLAQKIEEFGAGVQATFVKYQKEQKDDPAKTYENNSRQKVSGVDSFAAMGGGGNVFVGLSVLDVNKMQLKRLESIDEKLSTGGLYTGGLSTGALKTGGLTRTQTSSPVTSGH